MIDRFHRASLIVKNNKAQTKWNNIFITNAFTVDRRNRKIAKSPRIDS